MEVLDRSLRDALAVFRPPPRLSVSQWADQFRQLSREASSEPGQWRTARAEYQRDILDAISDPLTHTVVVMSCAQVGKSEMLLNGIGFHIAQDAAPILFLQPTVEMAETFAKDRIAPMIRDSPCLTALIAEPLSRSGGNTILHKQFPGGHLTLACGTVELRLAVANAVVAPEGTVSFDGTKSARRQFDPFACTMDRELACGALGQETSSAVIRRYTGKVAVQRIVAD